MRAFQFLRRALRRRVRCPKRQPTGCHISPPTWEALEQRSYLSVSFGVMPPFAAGASGQQQNTAPPVTADFNGDGKADLAVTTLNFDSNDNPNLIVNIFLGNGDGTFNGPVTSINTGVGESNVIVGDFTGNGHIGFAVNDSEEAVIRVYPGNGDGTFGTPIVVPDGIPHIGMSQGLCGLTVADLNGDGCPDLIAMSDTVASQASNVFINNGSGLFTQTTTLPYLDQTLLDTGGYAVGNFGGGHADLVAADSTSFFYLAGNGDGTFAAPVTTPITGGGAPIVGDFNGDGNEDAAMLAPVSSTSSQSDITVLLGNGDGTFQPEKQTPTVDSAFDAVAADIDGDGKEDLVVTDTGSDVFSVQPGNGDGTFQTPQTFELPPDFYQPAVGDFNGDGSPDLAFSTYSPTFGPVGEIEVFINGQMGAAGGGGGGGGGGGSGSSVNLTPTLSVSLPGAAVGGAKAAAVKGKLTITNDGTAAYSGTASVDLYFSSSAELDTSTAALAGSLSAGNLKLKVGASRTVPVKLKNFPNVAAGSYYLAALVTADGTTFISNVSNNPISLAPPFIDLADSYLTTTPTAAKPGRKTTLIYTLTNNGNVPAVGNLANSIAFSTSSDGSDPLDAETVTKRINLKAGAHTVIRLSVPIPADLTAATYFPVLTVDPNNVFSDTNFTNNTVVSSDGIAVS